MIPDYQLIHGDCLIEMDAIADNSIDMILADLPYGVTECAFDIVIPFEPLWKQYKRVIKKNGAIVLFGSEPFSSLLRLSNLEWYRYDWVWNKIKPSNFQLMNFQPGKIHENIMVFSPSPAVFNTKMTMVYCPQKIKLNHTRVSKKTFYGSSNSTLRQNHSIKELDGDKIYSEKQPVTIIDYSNAVTKNRLHPTQKPVALLSYLIKTYTNEGETVLDNTCGSGSTLEAAMRTGRHSIGIEKDLGYFEIASRRLANIARELRGEWKPMADNGKGYEDLPMFAGL